jgi:hypothetical protein
MPYAVGFFTQSSRLSFLPCGCDLDSSIYAGYSVFQSLFSSLEMNEGYDDDDDDVAEVAAVRAGDDDAIFRKKGSAAVCCVGSLFSFFWLGPQRRAESAAILKQQPLEQEHFICSSDSL